MSNKYNSTETLIFTSYNNTEKILFNIDTSFAENNTDPSHSNNNISFPYIEFITPNVTGPSSMENSIVWTIICDLIGAPCMVAFLYVLYRGIEVFSIWVNFIFRGIMLQILTIFNHFNN